MHSGRTVPIEIFHMTLTGPPSVRASNTNLISHIKDKKNLDGAQVDRYGHDGTMVQVAQHLVELNEQGFGRISIMRGLEEALSTEETTIV